MNKGNGSSGANALNIDFKIIARKLKKSNVEQIRRAASAQLPHNIALLKGMIDHFVPEAHQGNFYFAFSAAMSSTAQIAMIEYRMAEKAVDHEPSEEKSRAKGEASRALTWKVANKTRNADGTLLSFKLLTAAVNKERSNQEPALGAIDERQVRRHIRDGEV